MFHFALILLFFILVYLRVAASVVASECVCWRGACFVLFNNVRCLGSVLFNIWFSVK